MSVKPIIISICMLFVNMASIYASDLELVSKRVGTEVTFSQEKQTSIIDLKGAIGEAEIKRLSENWSDSIKVRLHISGLESFKAKSPKSSILAFVKSTGNHDSHFHLQIDDKKKTLDIKVKMVSKGNQFPVKDGYFEVPLPKEFFKHNPEKIQLSWVDFYRR